MYYVHQKESIKNISKNQQRILFKKNKKQLM